MRLNLGCGDDIRDGYVNVDQRRTHPSVYECDLSKFPWPWATGVADEIMMLDFLEHFPYRDTDRILLECFRVLKAGGELVVQVPDGEHLTRALTQDGRYLCNRCGESMFGLIGDGDPVEQNYAECPKCKQSAEDIADAAMRRLYGGQDYPGNFHHTVFTQRSLRSKARMSGFELIGYEETTHQYANWNFKARFVKGDIW